VGEAGGGEGGSTEASVPATEDALHDHHGEVVGGAPANTLNGDGNVGGVGLVVTDADLRANEGSLGVGETAEAGGVGRGWEGREVLLGELDEFTMVNATSSNEDHAVRGVVGLDVVGQVLSLY